jgi:hypothetical protein
MLKRGVLFGIVFVLCILIVPGQLTLHVKRGNLWTIYLEQNCESILLLFKDGTLIVATCYLENMVVIPWEYVFSEGREPKDLLVVIHNHLGIERWSSMDNYTNHMFRDKGYAGPILLKLGNGQVIEWED